MAWLPNDDNIAFSTWKITLEFNYLQQWWPFFSENFEKILVCPDKAIFGSPLKKNDRSKVHKIMLFKKWEPCNIFFNKVNVWIYDWNILKRSNGYLANIQNSFQFSLLPFSCSLVENCSSLDSFLIFVGLFNQNINLQFFSFFFQEFYFCEFVSKKLQYCWNIF